MIEIEDFVVEALEAALGDDEQADRNIEAREPRGCLGQMAQVLDVFHDVCAGTDAPHGWDEADAVVGSDHGCLPSDV